jgi:Ran GTPase-activating protein (RanGAP) involved in mRNA processing and transport
VGEVRVSKELLEAADQLLKLVKITFVCVQDFSAVEPALLTRLANRLEKFKLFGDGLTKEQVEAILQGILQGSSRLRILKLDCNELFAVAPALLAEATNKLEEVELLSLGQGNGQDRMLTRPFHKG